jgi:beta-exotoxin I transport system permease protein
MSDWFTSFAALVGRSLARARALLIAACVLLAVFQIALVIQAGSQYESNVFDRMSDLMPAFLRRTLGDLTFAILSFEGVVSAGYFHPVIVLLIAHLAVYVATEPAHDVEAGLVDLILARPVPRHALITRSLVVVGIAASVVPAAMALTMWSALRAFSPEGAPWPSARSVMRLSISLASVSACFGAIALAIATSARRRGTAVATASILMLLAYLVMFLEPTWAPARAVGWLSPFHYFRPILIVAGRADVWRDLIVLGGVSAVAVATAYWTFARRDM